MALDNNYNGLTTLKDWWGKVKANFTYLDNRISTIITTPAEGVSAQEIIDARKGELALSDKIDALDLADSELFNKIGNLSNLTTIEKTNLVGAISEVKDEFTSHEAEKATEEDLGHVKVDGTTITIDENGVISGGGSGKFVVGSFTRSTTTASGTQAITGLGFKPKFIIFLAAVSTAVGRMSVGITDGTNGGCLTDLSGDPSDVGKYTVIDQYIYMRQGDTSVNAYHGTAQSMDDDGFTINWTKGSGAVDGETIKVKYLAGR